MTRHRGWRLWRSAALLVAAVIQLGGCSRPTPCERLFEAQVRCSWSKRDPDKDQFLRECAKSFGPLTECAQASGCDGYKGCLATALARRSSLAAAWRRSLLECGLDTEGGHETR